MISDSAKCENAAPRCFCRCNWSCLSRLELLEAVNTCLDDIGSEIVSYLDTIVEVTHPHNGTVGEMVTVVMVTMML